MSRELSVIIKKELMRVFTDRRLVFTVFILPALSIALVYSIMGFMIKDMVEDIEDNVSNVYIKNMPSSFERHIENSEKNMEITLLKKDQSIDNIKKEIYNGNVDYLIVFEEDFEKKLNNYEIGDKPNLETYYNPSEDYSNEIRYEFESVIFLEYKNEILSSRLGNSDYIEPYYFNKDNQDSEIQDTRKATGKGLSTLIPFLISIFLFSGAMSVGLDSIAGEKERGTMATLLVTPVKRETIAFGKIISLGIIAIVSTLSQFLGIVISMPFASMLFSSGPASEASEVKLSALQYGLKEFGLLILIMITMAGLYVALICTISIFARTVKEASTYMTPVYMVVMIAGVSTMFSNSTPGLIEYMIPIYGSIVAMKGLLTFETTLLTGMMTIVSTIIYIIIFGIILKRMFNSEKVMFNA